MSVDEDHRVQGAAHDGRAARRPERRRTGPDRLPLELCERFELFGISATGYGPPPVTGSPGAGGAWVRLRDRPRAPEGRTAAERRDASPPSTEPLGERRRGSPRKANDGDDARSSRPRTGPAAPVGSDGPFFRDGLCFAGDPGSFGWHRAIRTRRDSTGSRVRPEARKTTGPGSWAAGLALATMLLGAAPGPRRVPDGGRLVGLLRAGVTFRASVGVEGEGIDEGSRPDRRVGPIDPLSRVHPDGQPHVGPETHRGGRAWSSQPGSGQPGWGEPTADSPLSGAATAGARRSAGGRRPGSGAPSAERASVVPVAPTTRRVQ